MECARKSLTSALAVGIVTAALGCAQTGRRPYYMPAPAPGPTRAQVYSDSLYRELRARPLDSLSDREYRTLMEMERQRSEIRAEKERGLDTFTTILVMVGALTILGLVIHE